VPDLWPLPPVNRRHLDVLTGELGIMQHAVGPRPDPAHGSCTDDVARALQVDLLHQRELGWSAVAASAGRNLRFLDEALDRDTGRFRNFRRSDGAWHPGLGSEDCHGRALLALGETMAGSPGDGLAEVAERLFAEALPAARSLVALRARSSALLGCEAAMRVAPTRRTANTFDMLCDGIRSTFEAPGTERWWLWPEPQLTYENALPTRALLVAGHHRGDRRSIAMGEAVLGWLVEVQTAPGGHLSPIGNGWWPLRGERSRFDQQPIEATALLLAARTALAVTGDPQWQAVSERAYAWFLGANDVGVRVCDPERGAGYDGLTPSGVNVNQGAESTLMWLIALEHTRSMREGLATTPATIPTTPVLASRVG
jgi:hypothetical protein